MYHVTAEAERVEALREAVGASAAGWWRATPEGLALIAFAPAPDLSPEVAAGFVEATRLVPIDQPGLGIIEAARTLRPAVSIASELPAEVGSGRWLRAFGAERSVAVPILDESGRLEGVASVALKAGVGGVVEIIRARMTLQV